MTVDLSPYYYSVDSMRLFIACSTLYSDSPIQYSNPVPGQYNIAELYPGTPYTFASVLMHCTCMAIDRVVQCNGGLLPDVMMLALCYYY